jgi:hypothetical protein
MGTSAGLLMCPLYQSIKLNLELTSSPFLMCNISEKGRLGAIYVMQVYIFHHFIINWLATGRHKSFVMGEGISSGKFGYSRNLIKIRSWAPRRSLGNYRKISLPSYLRGAHLCLIIDRTSDSCVPMVLRKHTLLPTSNKANKCDKTYNFRIKEMC